MNKDLSQEIVLKDGKKLEHFFQKYNLSKEKVSSGFQRGAYDLTRFVFDSDTTGTVTLKSRVGCPGPHQHELYIHAYSGLYQRNGDTLKIKVSSLYNRFYLVQVSPNGIIDSVEDESTIYLVTKTLYNTYCPARITRMAHNVEIIALPEKVNMKEIYVVRHPERTVGIFSYFAIRDKSGRIRTYPGSDWMLIGGNHLVNKEAQDGE